MKKTRNIILFISAISFILLITFLSLLLGEQFQIRSCGCPKMVSQNFIFLFILLSVIFVAGMVYYLLSLQLEKKEKVINFNLETIMKFLDNDEKDILNQIKKKDKPILQSEIKKLTKLRTHRALKKLKDKEIITTKKIGKMNIVQLNKNFTLK